MQNSENDFIELITFLIALHMNGRWGLNFNSATTSSYLMPLGSIMDCHATCVIMLPCILYSTLFEYYILRMIALN
jgi:hypothetical protein